MAAPTSTPMAVCVLVLTPLAYIFIISRIYVRLTKTVWGMDDWCMLAAQPGFIVLVVASLIMCWNGLGVPDSAVTAAQLQRAHLWWFIWQTDWLFTMIPLKWTICCCLLRIAEGRKLYVYLTIGMGTAATIMMLITVFYEFGACKPIQYNWDSTIPGGKCMDPSIETNMSFALSAVNIVVDWYCAFIPIPLLWNVQMRSRLKVSVAFILSIGVVASVSAIVRLKYTIGLSATSNLLYAEIGLGFIVSNLPALRPIYDKLSRAVGLSSGTPAGYGSTPGNTANKYSRKSRGARDQYLELGAVKDKGGDKTTQIHVTGGRSEGSDNDSQTHIVNDRHGIMVSQEVHVSRTRSPPNEESLHIV
ncbi:hypothetical protein PISL3812_09438 [Talaromyces islandicus]|uniref:Rhodopsin domain-containing protein n=1 Tax=Talaromyces islandicus TaxID=28573 RepID=A0A0U1MA14_TALIS|nr:hypothetical protein PISL3812_09438 [Talaromyces islandicus]